MDRLNPLDALFVDAEDADPHTSMAIASMADPRGAAHQAADTARALTKLTPPCGRPPVPR